MNYFLSFLAALCFAVIGQAEVPRAEQLKQIFAEMSRRYTDGKYVTDNNLITEFNLKQDAMVSALKNNGGLKKVLFIKNDYRPQLTVTLYAFIDEEDRFLSVYWDKSEYYDEEERSYLRFANAPMLARGLKFVPLGGSHALVVNGLQFEAATGGTLQFNYLKDYQADAWGITNLPLLRKNNSWGIYNENLILVTEAMVKSWTGFFNGGVSEFILR